MVNGTVVMPGATVEEGASLVDCVLGPGSSVAAGLHLKGVTVGDGARVDSLVEPGSRVDCDTVTSVSRAATR